MENQNQPQKEFPSMPPSSLNIQMGEQIVEAHNGEILVNSEVDLGSTFTIRSPYSQRELSEGQVI